jgi:hypothetical protein
MEPKKEPQLLAEVQKDTQIQGYVAAAIRVRVHLLASGKYKMHLEKLGRSVALAKWCPVEKREYRHRDLDELIAIAMTDEKGQEMRAAIREAIYAAQDKIDGACTSS